PISGLVVGSSDIRSLPAASEERRAYEAITTGFEDLGVEPVTVLIETGIDDARVPALLDDIAALPEVADARAVPDLAEEATVVEFTPVGDATGEAAQSLVQQIRALAAASGLPSGVTGAAADVIDTRDHLLERLPLALAAIAVATFALLFALTRSVVVPLKAILLNALTIAATLGVLVAVFQWGWAGALLGIADPGPLDVTTPLLIGLLAFGLSMDYEVFLLARIREEWTRRDRAMPPRAANDRAVLRGVTATGPVVTTAAAAIVIVFLGFAISDVLALKEVGIGMAVAIILDVTIVRGLLLPATMTLLGRANWWRPGRSARRGSPASAR
ncbi:MAG: MMPL family transporter, partial [Microbacteriaceae bacterium]